MNQKFHYKNKSRYVSRNGKQNKIVRGKITSSKQLRYHRLYMQIQTKEHRILHSVKKDETKGYNLLEKFLA